MSDIVIKKQNEPSTPDSGDAIIYVDNTSGTLKTKNDNGTVTTYSTSGGTVSNVSASGTEGVTTNITNSTTTPNITIGLGDITPDSVAALGMVTGSNLSGTNTGDQDLSSFPTKTEVMYKESNILYVKTAPQEGEFASIKDAIVAIASSSSADNPYLIKIGAGIFIENNPLIVPRYVSIEGASIQTTFIQPLHSNEHLFVLAEGVELSFMSLQGTSGSLESGKAAIYCEDIGDFAQMHKLSIYDFDIGIDNYSNTSSSIVYSEYCDINGDFSYAIRNRSPNGQENRFQLENFYTYPSNSTIQTCILSEGSTASLLLHLTGFIGTSGQKGLVLRNGGTADVSATFFQDIGGTAILSENTGDGAILSIASTSFNNCEEEIRIDNPNTTGYFVGYRNITKTFIHEDSSFFIANSDSHIINVAKKGGDFTTIKDALNFITDNAVNNQYIIFVGPGLFLEDQLIGKEFVTITGKNTTISANNSSIPLIIGADAFIIEGLTIGGVTDVGVPTIYYESTGNSVGNIFIANTIQFLDTDTLVHIKGTTYPTVILLNNPLCGGTATFTTGFKCEDAGANFTQLNINNLLYQRFTTPYPTDLLFASGLGAEVNLLSAGVKNADAFGDFIHIENSAVVRINSCLISGYEKAFHVANVGGAPSIELSDIITDNISNYAILVEHPGTQGSIVGSFDFHKVLINDSSNISISYSDPVNGGFVTAGPLRVGSKQSDLTDVTDLIQLNMSAGSLEGGVISTSINPLDISVTSGFGYVADSITEKLKRVSWSASTLSLVDNATNYIYINNSGVPSVGSSLPSITQDILLGRVRTNAGIISFRAKIPNIIKNASNHIDEFLRTALGPIFVSGSIVSENGANPRKIDVSSGQYWFSKSKFTPSGGTIVTYKDFYHVSGVFQEFSGSTIDNTKYDNLTGLTNLTAGYFVKHTLYLAGDGSEESYALIRGQDQYNTLLGAQQANLASVPAFFADIATPIAAIIMQEGTNSIIDIIDIRPRVGFQSPSTSASADHGSLLGLGDDDHTQYLRTDGTRVLTGDQSFGGHNVTNVGTLNGVTVETHASRHTFNGTDPFLSATPQTIGTSNQEGVDNTHFARADHIHAHGSQTNPTQHAVADGSNNGFMSSANFTKLAGIATAATANSTDAILLARANHTGTQTASTISDFSSAADARISAQKGVASGIATLDSGIKIPIAQIPTAAPVTQNPDQTNAIGSSTNLAKADHVHNIPADAPTTTLSPATTNAEGTGTSFARNDHTHAIATGISANITTIQPDDASAAGSLDSFARADHKHAIVAAAAISISTSTANAEGTSTSFARADHTHDISLDNSLVSNSTLLSTTSLSDTLMTGMTLTPTAGTYLVRARALVSATSNARFVRMSIYSGNIQVTDTEVAGFIRTGGTFLSNGDLSNLYSDCVVTVNGSQSIEIRWRTSGGTAQTAPYSLNLTRLS